MTQETTASTLSAHAVWLEVTSEGPSPVDRRHGGETATLIVSEGGRCEW
jgi:hypothetical protein